MSQTPPASPEPSSEWSTRLLLLPALEEGQPGPPPLRSGRVVALYAAVVVTGALLANPYIPGPLLALRPAPPAVPAEAPLKQPAPARPPPRAASRVPAVKIVQRLRAHYISVVLADPQAARQRGPCEELRRLATHLPEDRPAGPASVSSVLALHCGGMP